MASITCSACMSAVRRSRTVCAPPPPAPVWSSSVGSCWPAWRACAQVLHRRVVPYREEVLAAVARGQLDVDAGTARLEAIRWLRRVSQHLERACYHLGAVAAQG
jgi:hypothetical protein